MSQITFCTGVWVFPGSVIALHFRLTACRLSDIARLAGELTPSPVKESSSYFIFIGTLDLCIADGRGYTTAGCLGELTGQFRAPFSAIAGAFGVFNWGKIVV